MPTSTISPRKRLATTAVLVVLGGAVAAGAFIGGQPGLGVFLVVFYAVCGLGTYLWAGGRGDAAAIMRMDGDERQRHIDRSATAIMGLVVGLFCIGGAVLDLATGGDGMPWVLICAVGGATYIIAIAVLRNRS